MKEQIEEMELTPIDILANDINQHCPDLKENYCGDTHCVACLANALYNAGYRKREWISVAERSPKRWEKCLCYYPQKDYGSKVVVDYAETDKGYFAEQYRFGAPSHWMPLPEPPSEVKDYPAYLDRPKMKGGAE